LAFHGGRILTAINLAGEEFMGTAPRGEKLLGVVAEF